MLPNTHAYATISITQSTNPLLLYGSIIPDIAATNILPWGIIDQQAENFLSYLIKKDKKLKNFGLGICLHELPIGIDRFTHTSYNGKTGYAYYWAKRFLLKQPYLLLAGKKALTIAHNFIESGVEYHILQESPETQQLIKKIVKKININQISRHLALFFKLDKQKTFEAFHTYNKAILDHDYSTIQGLTNFWHELITATGKNISKQKIESFIKTAITITKPTYKKFITDAIQQSTKDYKKFIQQHQEDYFSLQ